MEKIKKIFNRLFHPLMIVLNIIATVAFVLACLSCFINPNNIWWIGFFGLPYMHLLVVNLCFVVFWLFSSKKKMAVLSLVFILTSWPLIGRNIQLFAKKIPEDKFSKSFKVLSFNVQAFVQRETRQPNGFVLDMFDFFNEKDPDILCLQEFSVFSWSHDFNEANIHKRFDNTPNHHIELVAEGVTGSHYKYGIATFSKYPMIRKKLIFSDNTANACIYTDLLIGSDTVRVFNIHLKSVGFQNEEKSLLHNMVKKKYGRADIRAVISIVKQLSLSAIDREQQVEILCSYIEQSPYPIIICGDFNDPPTSYSYQKVRGLRKDAFVEAGKGRVTTFNIGRIASLRIDNILYSDVFKAYNFESPRVYLSDHFPVMCRLVKD